MSITGVPITVRDPEASVVALSLTCVAAPTGEEKSTDALAVRVKLGCG